MKKISFLTIVFLSLVACQDDDTSQNNEPVTIEFETVTFSMFSNPIVEASLAENFVIDNGAEWIEFSDFYHGSIADIDVDYTQNTVISSVSSFRTGIGELDAFEITSMIQQNDTIKVTVHSVEDITGPSLAMSYQPYHIVKIPKTDLPFKFTYTGDE